MDPVYLSFLLRNRKHKINNKKVGTHSRFLERLLLLSLLLLVFLCTFANCSRCKLELFTLLDYQLAVVLITRVIPGGLARGKVEIVDVTIHILAAEVVGQYVTSAPPKVIEIVNIIVSVPVLKGETTG